jgi:hypothetical protein
MLTRLLKKLTSSKSEVVMVDLTTLEKKLNKTFKQIKKTQSKTLSLQISANFIAGMTAAEKHKSIKSVSEEDESLTDSQKEEIALLVATYLGYLSSFNTAAQKQLISKASELLEEGKGEDEIQAYFDDVFSGKENKEIYVDKDLKLSEVSKTITKTFSVSLLSYAAMLAATASHVSYEKGKKASFIDQGNEQWVFSGPVDERARPHHIALVGKVFTWNTDQSLYAEQILQEPRCRHRSVPFYNDERDVKKEVWDKLKKDSGIFWNEEKNKWDIE